jgi:hypothetical protein
LLLYSSHLPLGVPNRLVINQASGDEGEDSLERTGSTTSPPPALSEDLVVDKKGKRVKDFASSSASAHKAVAGETPAPEDDIELFDLMDS